MQLTPLNSSIHNDLTSKSNAKALEASRLTEMPNLNDDAVLSIPTNEKDIAEIVLKLLGKGRTIGKARVTAFSIDSAGLLNLHHSIDQRVTL